MASIFTYTFTKSGFNDIITVYQDGSQIYSGRSSTGGKSLLLSEAKIALKDNYPGSSTMTEVSSTPTPPPPSVPRVPSSLGEGSLVSSTNSIPDTNNLTSNVNKDALQNLDKEKRDTLTDEQRKNFSTLTPSEVKILNNLPFNQIKNLNPDQLKSVANNNTEGLQDKVKNAQNQLDKIKNLNKQKFQELRNANNPNLFLKDQQKIDPVQAANILISIITPVLNQFINAEKISNIIVNKLINDVKVKLKDKGRIDVIDGAITFTPKNRGNYEVFKSNFDRKVNSLRKIVNILKKVIDTLLTILKIARTALAAFKAYLLLTQNTMKTKATAAVANLQSPTGPYVAAADYIATKEGVTSPISTIQDDLKKKIEKYELIARFLILILGIFKKLIDALKKKLDRLSFTINGLKDEEVSNILRTEPVIEGSEEEFEVGDKSYIIRVTKTLSGAYQVVAFDKFSRLKITQTAPSKTRTPNELIDEIKQILGQE